MTKKDINDRVMQAISIILEEKKNLTKATLAESLGVKPAKFSEILSGRMLAGTDIMSILTDTYNISADWLLTGNGNIYKEDTITTTQTKTKTLPLIPAEAFAGYGEYTYDDMTIEEYYAIQDFDNADFLIRIKGDSMSPKYNGGDIIACKVVKEVTFWQWHRVYAICTRNQGILIKRVEEYPQNRSFITLVSENPIYRPFELHEDEIVSVALVLGAIVME